MYNQIDGKQYKDMLIGAYAAFKENYEHINQLNVFPVPDGDTGTNMLNTLRSMYSMIVNEENESIGIIAEKAATGAIMGARGNSGVILSQIIQGLAKGLRGKKQASCREIGKAFQYGILYAYRAVVKPVEGTILSVARGIAKGTRDVTKRERDFSQVLRTAIESGQEALAMTPEQLPILKEANVVDAGGQGLLLFLEGCLQGLTGETHIVEDKVPETVKKLEVKGESFSIDYPYCTEFIVSPCKVRGAEARKALESWGESMIVAEGENLLKVHIHAQRPGHVLDMAADWGTLHDIKVDNMMDQFKRNKHIAHDQAKREIGVLAVVSGEGWKRIMEGMHAQVLAGGQTMNPSVQEIMQALDGLGSKHYIILPNNKNIILAAKQVQKILGPTLQVIPTANPAEGAAVGMVYDPQADIETNVAAMQARLLEIRSAGITQAVRDSSVDGIRIQKDDYMGLAAGFPVVTARALDECLGNVLENLLDAGEAEIVTLYFGADLPQEEAEGLLAAQEERYPEVEFELQNGGQPLYPFFISVE
ncbi:MAG: DAK2 domain-containing protein [Veillonellaceae bacterium]|nr:DAK2 domain-containing protein [Veillonellaceae bacterium]